MGAGPITPALRAASGMSLSLGPLVAVRVHVLAEVELVNGVSRLSAQLVGQGQASSLMGKGLEGGPRGPAMFCRVRKAHLTPSG